jgi:hypothetical protein
MCSQFWEENPGYEIDFKVAGNMFQSFTWANNWVIILWLNNEDVLIDNRLLSKGNQFINSRSCSQTLLSHISLYFLIWLKSKVPELQLPNHLLKVVTQEFDI